LKHEVICLSPQQRAVVEHECQRHCETRGWHRWAVNARSTHIHAVITAPGCSGRTIRDQLKANATRALRERWPVFCDRPVWTVGGDWECFNSEEELHQVCHYVQEAQDRKGLEQPGGLRAGLMHRVPSSTAYMLASVAIAPLAIIGLFDIPTDEPDASACRLNTASTAWPRRSKFS
jgi:REP element-mobilizing transposase RayT